MMQILIYGAATSAIYVLLAVGFTLIFGVARVINLAHGSFYALGAYAAFVLTAYGMPLLPAALGAVALVAVFGTILEWSLIRPFRHSQLSVLMITLVASIMVEQSLILAFGTEYRNVPAFTSETINVLGVNLSGQRALALVVGATIVAALWLFMQSTRLGSAILAISQDPEAAQYVGIPSNRIFSIVMAISASLAATAGVLAGPFLTVSPGMGLLPMIKAFSIVIVGGLGSIPGSILAALLLGYSETAVAFLLSSSWTELVSLAAVLLTLVLRPAGLFGRGAAF